MEEDIYPSDSETENWRQPLAIMETNWQHEEMVEDDGDDMDLSMD